MGWARRRLRKPAWRGALAGLICALGCWACCQTTTMRVLEDWAMDGSFILRGRRPSTAKVVIVRVDQASLDCIGKPLIFCSPELAEVVDYLHAAGSAAIGVDLLLPENEYTADYLLPGAAGDSERLGQAVSRAGNVVLPLYVVPDREPVYPAFEWRSARPPTWNDLGFVNLTGDDDGFVRRQRLRVEDVHGTPAPCFALALWGKAAKLPEGWLDDPQLRVQGRPLPVDAEGRLRINFVGPPGTIDSLALSDVLAAARGSRRLEYDFHDAIVLIGVTGLMESDRHATPYINRSLTQLISSVWRGQQPELMAGIEIHAHLIATLSDQAFISTPWLAALPLLLLTGVILGSLLARLNLAWGMALVLTHHVAWRGVCLGAFVLADHRVALTPMIMLGLLTYGVTFALRWRWMRQMLGLVKSEAIARALEADPGSLDVVGSEREITVLFSDIRGFTPYSECHAARDVVRLLNEYFTVVVPIIEAERGTITQYNGDGLMVIYGAPQSDPSHAERAVRSAIEMVERVHALGERWKSLDAPAFRIGVGIHTGPAVVGVVGSPRRLDYTAHGDTVNTAARIETANKELATEILMSDRCFRALSSAERERLLPRLTPHPLSVKGKTETLQVWSIDAATFRENAGGSCRGLSQGDDG